jgi:FeS assembly SUF system protein
VEEKKPSLAVVGQGRPAPSSAPSPDPAAPLQDQVVAVLRGIYDPEIPVNIWDLGLVYGLEVEGGRVHVRMTLTAPACPVADSLVHAVEDRLLALEGVTDAKVELVWDPPWTPARMSEAAKLELGLL